MRFAFIQMHICIWRDVPGAEGVEGRGQVLCMACAFAL
jgi:hypothetical protein